MYFVTYRNDEGRDTLYGIYKSLKDAMTIQDRLKDDGIEGEISEGVTMTPESRPSVYKDLGYDATALEAIAQDIGPDGQTFAATLASCVGMIGWFDLYRQGLLSKNDLDYHYCEWLDIMYQMGWDTPMGAYDDIVGDECYGSE